MASPIVTDGLIVHMDFSNTDSYPGTGTKLYNLIPNSSYNMTVQGTFSDGVFHKPRGSDIFGDSNVTAQTVTVSIKQVERVTGSHFIDLRPSGIELWYSASAVNGHNNYFDQVYIDGVLGSINDLGTFPNDQWITVTLVASTPFTDNVNLFSSSHKNSFNTMNLEVRSILMYDRALSAEDVASTANKPVILTLGIGSMDIYVKEVTGALSYKIVVTEDVSGENVYDEIVASFDTEYFKKIRSLTPGTAYTTTVSVNSGSGFEQLDQQSAQTLFNSSESYDLTRFGSNGMYDLSSLDSSEFDLIKDVIVELFSTGETLDIIVSGKKKSTVAVVKLGEIVSSDESILAPFDSSAGGGQSFTLQLSDNSTADIGFNEANNSITVGGHDYQEGETFVLDGKKCYIKNI